MAGLKWKTSRTETKSEHAPSSVKLTFLCVESLWPKLLLKHFNLEGCLPIPLLILCYLGLKTNKKKSLCKQKSHKGLRVSKSSASILLLKFSTFLETVFRENKKIKQKLEETIFSITFIFTSQNHFSPPSFRREAIKEFWPVCPSVVFFSEACMC